MGAVTDSSFAGSWLVGSLVGLEIDSKSDFIQVYLHCVGSVII